MKYKNIAINNRKIWFCLVGFLFLSCTDFLKVQPPIDQLTTKAVFSNDESAISSIAGIYSKIMQTRNTIANGGMSLYGGLSADELINTTNSPSYLPYSTNNILPTDVQLLPNFWTAPYNYIYQANAIIDNLNNANGISDSVKNQLLGEAKFFRAFFHFYMTNLFGSVPLSFTPDYRINAILNRSDSSTVYSQIVTDLTDAQDHLSKTSPSGDNTRVNYWVATAFLARVYLYMKDWTDASSQASIVINSGIYQLETLNNTFLTTSTEAIFQIAAPISSSANTAEGQNFIPSFPSARPTFVLSKSLLNSFEPADQRKTNWTKTSTINGVDYTYPYKYKIANGSPGADKIEYNMIIRLAELYLLRAEAWANMGDLDGAVNDIDEIRSRAGLPDLDPGLTMQQVNDAIQQENKIEFFAEWGHRWFDLKRTGMVDPVLSAEKPQTWKSTAAIFPIPQSEINSDPFLGQNPGY